MWKKNRTCYINGFHLNRLLLGPMFLVVFHLCSNVITCARFVVHFIVVRFFCCCVTLEHVEIEQLQMTRFVANDKKICDCVFNSG